MGRQGDRLAWILAHSNWVETLVKESRGDPENEASYEFN
jgi:hypothetical protein